MTAAPGGALNDTMSPDPVHGAAGRVLAALVGAVPPSLGTPPRDVSALSGHGAAAAPPMVATGGGASRPSVLAMSPRSRGGGTLSPVQLAGLASPRVPTSAVSGGVSSVFSRAFTGPGAVSLASSVPDDVPVAPRVLSATRHGVTLTFAPPVHSAYVYGAYRVLRRAEDDADSAWSVAYEGELPMFIDTAVHEDAYVEYAVQCERRGAGDAERSWTDASAPTAVLVPGGGLAAVQQRQAQTQPTPSVLRSRVPAATERATATRDAFAPPRPPAPDAVSVTDASVTLCWDAGAFPATRFELYACDAPPPMAFERHRHVVYAGSERRFCHAGLRPSTTVRYAFVAFDAYERATPLSHVLEVRTDNGLPY